MFSVSTFRILGNGAGAQNLFALLNTAPAGGQIIEINEVIAHMEVGAANVSLSPMFRVCRLATPPTGGSPLSPVRLRTTTPLPVNGSYLGANASDGGAETAIVATPTGTIGQALGWRMHTLVGQVISRPIPVWPLRQGEEALYLAPGESALVHLVAAAASNPATNHYLIVCNFGVSTP